MKRRTGKRGQLYIPMHKTLIISISKDIEPSFGGWISLAIVQHVRSRTRVCSRPRTYYRICKSLLFDSPDIASFCSGLHLTNFFIVGLKRMILGETI